VSPGRVLVDTSSWVEALRADGSGDVRSRVQEILVSGQAVVCDMVLLELWNGAHGEQERRKLSRLEAELEVLPTSDEIWALARRLAQRARERGRTFPATDILIAACAVGNGADIEAVDEHIEILKRIASDVTQ
jgi:predicted nucleic acid-binding protein